jgi:hypothetical protein
VLAWPAAQAQLQGLACATVGLLRGGQPPCPGLGDYKAGDYIEFRCSTSFRNVAGKSKSQQSSWQSMGCQQGKGIPVVMRRLLHES